MKRVLLLVLSLILSLSITACGKKSTANTAPGQAAPKGGSVEKAKLADGVSTTEAPKTSNSVNYSQDTRTESNIKDDRKIIYNASVSLDVKDLSKAYDSAISKAKEMGGYISDAEIYETSSTVTVKVPAARMTDYLAYLDTLGGTRREQNIKMEDVTDQYTDSQSRLNNLKAQEEQLLTIMKKASTIDEIMKVQNEVSRVRGDIEVLQGRINLWNNLIEMCTITVRLDKAAEVGGKDVKVSLITWNEMIKAMSNGFKSTFSFVARAISSIFIFIVSIVPLLPFIAIIVWLALWYRKKYKKKNS